MSEALKRFVLLGRDGVINRCSAGHFVDSWERFEFLPHAIEALRLLAESSYIALVVSHQEAVAKHLLSTHELDKLTRRLLLEVALAGGNIRQVYYCRHRKEDNCTCRFPQPGLILRARLEHRFIPQKTFFIAESPAETKAAYLAGCPPIVIRREAFLEQDPSDAKRPRVASSLFQAVQMILSEERNESPVRLHEAIAPRNTTGGAPRIVRAGDRRGWF